MKRILTAAVLIPAVLLIVFEAPFWLLVLATAIVAGLAAWEFLALADASGARTPRILVLLAIGLLFAASFRNTDLVAPVLSVVTLVIFADAIFRSPLERVLPDVASSVFCILYIGLSLTAIPRLRMAEHGASLLLFLFCVVWVGDVAALYAGRAFGRRKLAPAISPGKTWEGSTASLAGSLITAVVLYFVAQSLAPGGMGWLSYPGPLPEWLGLAAVLNVAAQLGDLVESAIKRGARVKDSGSMLPGHGGILDRIDALLLAAPVLWYAQLIRQYFS